MFRRTNILLLHGGSLVPPLMSGGAVEQSTASARPGFTGDKSKLFVPFVLSSHRVGEPFRAGHRKSPG
jgi:hypothetical protein